MSESAPEAGGGNFLTRKLGPLPVWAWGVIITGGAVAYFWWRGHSSASSSSSSISSTTASTSATASQLSALQNEIDQLMQDQESGSIGATGTGTSPVSGGGPASTKATTPASTKTTTPATPPATGGGGGGGTKTAVKPKAPATPTGVHATKVTASSITLAWTKVTGATSYRIRITYQDKLVKQQTTTGNSVTVSGLGADHTYGIHVASVGPGGTSAETGSDVKTSKS